jgi:acyl-CoA thioesterase
MSLLRRTCTLERVAPGVHVRETDRTWWGHDAQFGGYVEALALAAMQAELGAPDMRPVTAGVQFFRPFGDGEFRAEVSVERRGRTMANLLARLYSRDRLAGLATATFGIRRPAAEFTAIAPPPAVLDQPITPGEEPAQSQLGIPTHERFTFFPRVGTFTFGGGEAEVAGWVRPREPAPVDELLMAMLQDLWVPAGYHRWREPAVAVSIDITTQFRAAFPVTDLGPDDALFVSLRTAASVGGFIDEDSEIWSPKGELLAQGRQMRYVHG